jgi:hypothetical protein
MAARLRSVNVKQPVVGKREPSPDGSGTYTGVDARKAGTRRRKPRTQHSENITVAMMADHPRDTEYIATSWHRLARVKLARWHDKAAEK